MAYRSTRISKHGRLPAIPYDGILTAYSCPRSYHIVHFDGHGVYADLSKSKLADWNAALSTGTLGGEKSGKPGYLLFEHPSEDKMCPVDGQTLGQLLHDNGIPILVLNACQSARHEAAAAPKTASSVHDEIRAVGSLARVVIAQGIPVVLGLRYARSTGGGSALGPVA